MPSLNPDDATLDGEMISKNGVQYKHQKPQQFTYPPTTSNKMMSSLEHKAGLMQSPAGVGLIGKNGGVTAAQEEVSGLIKRIADKSLRG